MKHYLIFFYALLLSVLFSCSSANEEEPIVPPSDVPGENPGDKPETPGDKPDVTPPQSVKWTFSYTLPAKESENTRAVGSELQFEQLDGTTRVGLFCLKSNGTFHFNNLKYKDGADGTLVPDDGVEAPKKYSGTCQIISCAPYSENFNSLPENVTFPVLLDQTSDEGLLASDLLWGVAEANDQMDNVNITFRRILPRWVLTVTIGGGLKPEDFQGATFAIYKVMTQVGFNAKTGETDDNPLVNGNIKFLNIGDDNTASTFVGTVLLPPQDCKACYLQIIFKDGVKRYFKFDPTVFKQGRQYYSTIQLTGYLNNIIADIKSWDEEKHDGYIKNE